MKSYFFIVLFRLLEILSRFFFLGQCLKIFSFEVYGEISYRIAFYQFIASMLYSGTLQSLSKYSIEEFSKQKSIITSLFFIALTLTALMFLFDGYPVFIFLFYAILYIMNGWYGTQDGQIVFSFIRSLSFVGQVLFFSFIPTNSIVTHIYLSFGISTLILLTFFPFKLIHPQLIPLKEWGVFFKFQVHNLSFQLTKITERSTLLLILDKKTFGLYSSMRDIINAANLAFFSPIYQTYYKKLANGFNYKSLLRTWTIILVSGSVAGIGISWFFGDLILMILVKIGIKKFTDMDLLVIIFFLSLDFFRSIQMMIFESKLKFKTLYLSHALDFLILGLSTLLIFSNVLHYTRLFLVLFCRLISINLYFGWKKKEL